MLPFKGGMAFWVYNVSWQLAPNESFIHVAAELMNLIV